tara:strand:- start:2804 stop:3229 length:426 start_codon:yes stop_codon:yes gene_type:complete
MVYLYAGLGVVMLSGIMAIFEMGLALTGQTLLPVPPDDYLSNQSMKDADVKFLKAMADEITPLVDDKAFPELVSAEGLCAALNAIDGPGWLSITDGRWKNGCQRSTLAGNLSHRVIISEDPYRLFSCALAAGSDQCAFEFE